jgi:hypothetical protein
VRRITSVYLDTFDHDAAAGMYVIQVGTDCVAVHIHVGNPDELGCDVIEINPDRAGCGGSGIVFARFVDNLLSRSEHRGISADVMLGEVLVQRVLFGFRSGLALDRFDVDSVALKNEPLERLVRVAYGHLCLLFEASRRAGDYRGNDEGDGIHCSDDPLKKTGIETSIFLPS